MRYLEDDTPPERIHQARTLRNHPTAAESKLWKRLNRNQILGLKFRRQWPVGPSMILDFYCIEIRLAVEVDGSVHLEPGQRERDRGKEFELAQRGIRLLRFTNDEVMSQIDMVVERITTAAGESRPSE